VHGPQGTRRFAAVIVALPLAVLRAGQVRVPIPDWKRHALDTLVAGQAAKLHLPLRQRPVTSAVMSVDDSFWSWTARDESAEVAPVLNAFLGSADAIERLRVLSEPDTWYARLRATRPDLDLDPQATPITTLCPSDPLAAGAYTSRSSAVRQADIDAIQAPVGAVHFAGDYTDSTYIGLMEGAVRSGRRAARDLLASLAHQPNC
jgi:monoamine oxidase